MKTRLVPAITCAVWLCAPVATHAQSAENVAVVINDAQADSVRVGEHYVRQRGIPDSNVIRIQTALDESVSRAVYTNTIEGPIAVALSKGRLQDQILFLVLAKGIPVRIAGTSGQQGTGASVDSELTLLYRRMVGTPVLLRGRIDNPYFLGERAITEARPFSRGDHDIFLVSRLDAFTVDEALALVDRAAGPEQDGHIVLDQRAVGASRAGDDWLAEAASRLTAAGHADRVILETTPKPARDVSPVLGYYSWGSSDPENRQRRLGLEFVPGAIAAAFGSSDARTFREPPSTWRPAAEPAQRTAQFAGSAHSLIGDLIREGVSGVAGHVSEPFLHSVVRPEVLFDAYLAGFTLIESFYLALPSLSWQSVVVGDPLARPFQPPPTDDVAPSAGVDPETDLPTRYSARRVEHMLSEFPQMPRAAVSSWVRAAGARERDDMAAARLALEQTAELAPDMAEPRLELAMMYDEAKEVDAAIAQYRRVLELAPRSVVALNNLAYTLAEHKGALEEALPIAERAVALAPDAAHTLDTLAWVEHRLGRNSRALPRLARAVQLAPGSAEVRLHLAIVYAATGDRARAEAQLKEALRLDPSLEDTEPVTALRERLREP